MKTDDDRDYSEDPVVTERDELSKECERLANENAELRTRLSLAMQVIDACIPKGDL